MFYETAQTIGPGWHGKSFKPSHYDDMSWSNLSSSPGRFRSPGSSPTIRRRIIINRDDDDDKDSDPRVFQRRSPTFDRKFFKDVWNDRPRREDIFEDRPDMFKRTAKKDWDKDIEDFKDSMRHKKNFHNEYDAHEDDDNDDEFETASGRVHHIPILVERQRGRMNDDKSRRRRCSSPDPSEDQQDFVDESDEWLQRHMDRLKQNFGSGFSTMQNRHSRHRPPHVDPNSRPRAFTSPIPNWGPESVHTLPTRKQHSRVFMDNKRNPKSVFRSYSETHEEIPRDHPTASRSHSDSHCPKTTYVTRVSVNVPSETAEDSSTKSHDDNDNVPEAPPRRTRYRPRKETDMESELDAEQLGPEPTSTLDGQQTECKSKPEKTNEANEEAKSKRRSSTKDARGTTAFLQISAVLQNVEDLIRHVEAYSGNGRDKQFRFLDEMLTRCMLRLDNVDTEGLEDVRNARKDAVRQVQSLIEKLESQATEDKGRKTTGEEVKVAQVTEEVPENVEIQPDGSMACDMKSTCSSEGIENTKL